MRVRQFIPLAAAAAALALGLGSPLRATADEATINLKRVYKEGESDRYRMTAVVETDDMKVSITLVVSEKVKELKLDGAVTLVATVESGSMAVNGKDSPFPLAGQIMTTTLDRNGKTVRTEGSMGSIGDMLNGASSGLPSRPLKIGEVVKVEVPAPTKDGKPTTGTITVVGREKASADIPVETIKLKTTMTRPAETPEAKEPTTINGTAYIEPGTGKAYKMEGAVTGYLPAPIGKGTVTFTRVLLADKDAPAGAKPAAKPTETK